MASSNDQSINTAKASSNFKRSNLRPRDIFVTRSRERYHQPPSHVNCLQVRLSKNLIWKLLVYILLLTIWMSVSAANSAMETLLLDTLVAFAGATPKVVATTLSISVVDSQMLVEGDLDFRCTLGVDPQVSVEFKDITVG